MTLPPFRLLWVVAPSVVLGWAGIALADAEQRRHEEAVQRPEATGSAAASKACKNASAKAIQTAEFSAEVRKRIPVFYSEIRQPVHVKLDKDFRITESNPRAKGFFQLAGAHDKKLCAEVLEVFNEPDSRFLDGEDDRNHMRSDWLSNNSRIVPFIGVENSGVVLGTKDRKRFECTTLDIDGDGRVEYLYRYTTWYSSKIFQDVEIMDHTADALSCRSDLPQEFVFKHMNNMLGAMNERFPEEWEATRGNPVYGSITGDKRSREMVISPKDCNEIVRNVGGPYSVFWNF